MNTKQKPIYQTLVDTIMTNIKKGIYKKGERIPSERDLCSLYDISRITVRLAIKELVHKGILTKVQGKGTFVANTSIVQDLNSLYSFSKEMDKQGRINSTQIIKREKVKATPHIAKQLGVEPGSTVIYIERLRCSNSDAVIIEKAYFKANFSFLIKEDFTAKGLYKTLAEKYNIIIDEAVESFKACLLDPYESELLDDTEGYGLLIKRISYSKGEIIAYSVAITKGDSFEFTIKLNGQR